MRLVATGMAMADAPEVCDAAGLIAAETVTTLEVVKWQSGNIATLQDSVAEEVPVAMIYNGISHAVMLASPNNFEDFAVGFSLCEGIIRNASDIYSMEVVPQANGVEVQLEIAAECFVNLKERRRNLTGRTGCGLCGAESLQHALRLPELIKPSDATSASSKVRFDIQAIKAALGAMQAHQPLQAMTGATHASAWVSRSGEIRLLREDVGRHNALDKLIGALAVSHRNDPSWAEDGFVITTSRASYEMVQKVATVGIPMLVAISAPTGLAVRIAERYGITLVGFARSQQLVIYSGGARITI